jgi:HD superfamily phosphohydrolase
LDAALLHDVGHGPFSHVSEIVLDEIGEAKDVHEAISVALIRTNTEIVEAIGQDRCWAAADLVAGTGGRSVYRDIVSGSTDADKLDYLLRDSYYAGVKYGQYDLSKIVESATRIGSDESGTQLGFTADGVWAVEGLLLARHHMWRQVYAHKTRLATDIMITRALRSGIEEMILPREAYQVAKDENGAPAPDEDFLNRYLQETEASVTEKLRSAPETTICGELMRRLQRRELLKQTVCLRLHELGPLVRDRRDLADVQDDTKFTPAKCGEIEARIAERYGVSAHLVAIKLDKWSNPTYRLGESSAKEIMFERDGEIVPLHDESEIFREERGVEHAYLYLYTPFSASEKGEEMREVLWRELGFN